MRSDPDPDPDSTSNDQRPLFLRSTKSDVAMHGEGDAIFVVAIDRLGRNASEVTSRRPARPRLCFMAERHNGLMRVLPDDVSLGMAV